MRRTTRMIPGLAALMACGTGSPTHTDATDGDACKADEIVLFANEDWYQAVDGTQTDFPSASWAVETELRGTLIENEYVPPPPHRPALFWLDDIRFYSGSPATTNLVRPYVNQRIVVFGKTGDVCSGGLQEYCVPEIWAARLWRECDN